MLGPIGPVWEAAMAGVCRAGAAWMLGVPVPELRVTRPSGHWPDQFARRAFRTCQPISRKTEPMMVSPIGPAHSSTIWNRSSSM